MWGGAPSFWKQHSVRMVALSAFDNNRLFWLLHLLKLIWTYHFIDVHSTPDCYAFLRYSCFEYLLGILLRKYKCLLMFPRSGAWKTHSSAEVSRREKLELTTFLLYKIGEIQFVLNNFVTVINVLLQFSGKNVNSLFQDALNCEVGNPWNWSYSPQVPSWMLAEVGVNFLHYFLETWGPHSTRYVSSIS